MKLKTALELLGDDGCMKCFGGMGCDHDLELVARRAREEAYEMAAKVAEHIAVNGVPAAIRALPTEPK